MLRQQADRIAELEKQIKQEQVYSGMLETDKSQTNDEPVAMVDHKQQSGVLWLKRKNGKMDLSLVTPSHTRPPWPLSLSVGQ